MPFIYGLLIPLAVLDVAVSVFQAAVFRLWNVPRVSRAAYVGLARRELPYLTHVQRLNCAYCSYANGVLAYAREIASRTEQYWCPIKFRLDPLAPHARYRQFLPYGDGVEIQARMNGLRRSLQREASDDAGPEN